MMQKQRVFILSDIEADPDDTQSLVRLLLYSNVLDIEGLVATTSIHQKERVVPESIFRVLDAYEQVRICFCTKEGFPQPLNSGLSRLEDSLAMEWKRWASARNLKDRNVWKGPSRRRIPARFGSVCGVAPIHLLRHFTRFRTGTLQRTWQGSFPN